MAPAGAQRCLAAPLAHASLPSSAHRSSSSTLPTWAVLPSGVPRLLSGSSEPCAPSSGVISLATALRRTNMTHTIELISSRMPPCGRRPSLASLATRGNSYALRARLPAPPARGQGALAPPATVAQSLVPLQRSSRVVSWPPYARRPPRRAGCPCQLHGGHPPMLSQRSLPIVNGTAPAASSARCTGLAWSPGRALRWATPCPFHAAWFQGVALRLPRLRSSSTGAPTCAVLTRRRAPGPCSGTSGPVVPPRALDVQPWPFRG